MNLRFLAVTGAVLLCAGGLSAQSVVPASDGGAGTVLPSHASALPPLAHADEPCQGAPEDKGPWGCLDKACPYPYQFWASADFLLWRIRNASLPTGASAQAAGLVGVTTFTNGVPTTTALPVFTSQTAGLPVNDSQGRGDHAGLRLTAGYWFDPNQDCGIEVSGFYLQPRTASFNTIANGAQVSNSLFTVGTGLSSSLTSPPAPAGLAGSLPVVFLGLSNSSAAVSTTTNLWGLEVNALATGVFFGPVRVSGLLGFRQLQLRDDLTLTTNEMVTLTPQASSPLFPVIVTGNGILPSSTFDRVSTRNTFYGGQAGLEVEAPCGCFFLRARGKVALGDMHEAADINGVTTTTTGNFAGGLLSSPVDTGRHVRDRIAVIPEANIKLGVFVTSHLTAYVGYDVFYISDVARPGDLSTMGASSTTVTVGGTNNQVSLPQPGFHFQGNHLWVQGFNFGMEFRY